MSGPVPSPSMKGMTGRSGTLSPFAVLVIVPAPAGTAGVKSAIGSSREAAGRGARRKSDRHCRASRGCRQRRAGRRGGAGRRAHAHYRRAPGAAPAGCRLGSADLEVPGLHHFALVEDLHAVVAGGPAIGLADLEGAAAGAGEVVFARGLVDELVALVGPARGQAAGLRP